MPGAGLLAARVRRYSASPEARRCEFVSLYTENPGPLILAQLDAHLYPCYPITARSEGGDSEGVERLLRRTATARGVSPSDPLPNLYGSHDTKSDILKFYYANCIELVTFQSLGFYG
jgi:hypothetical protein